MLRITQQLAQAQAQEVGAFVKSRQYQLIECRDDDAEEQEHKNGADGNIKNGRHSGVLVSGGWLRTLPMSRQL